MTRQTIILTEPNDKWLKSLEYSSKSELINDLIRQARKQQKQLDWLRLRLEKAEKSGFTQDSKEENLRTSKDRFSG